MIEIHPDATIGPVSLSVADLDRSLAYYQQAIGLKVQRREGETVTLGVGQSDLLILKEQPQARLVRNTTGLYHFALLVPSRLELARTLQHLAESQTPLIGLVDHNVSEAMYLADPDGHGIEIYRDRPRQEWQKDAKGQLIAGNAPFDTTGVLAELAGAAQAWTGLHPNTVMGHIHLHVADLAAAEQFYGDVLGFALLFRYPSASFMAAGGYHHHLGLNTWAGVGVPPPPDDAARLLRYEIRLPDAAALTEVTDRIQAAGLSLTKQDGGWLVRDPSQNNILLRQRE
jgi:catechol 2,3-dioxygenase